MYYKVHMIKGLKLAITSLCISCTSPTMSAKDIEACNKFPAGNKGFWIAIQSDRLRQNKIEFWSAGKKVLPDRTELINDELRFLLKPGITLKDTLVLIYDNKKYTISDFSNVVEKAIEGSTHEEIEICRVSKAKINGAEVKDSNNNMLILKMSSEE